MRFRNAILVGLLFYVGQITNSAEAQQATYSNITIHGVNESNWAIIEETIVDSGVVIGVPHEPNLSLEETVQRVCPGASESYLNTISSQFNIMNSGLINADANVIIIPNCLGASAEKYPVFSGETVWDIYAQQSNSESGIADWEEFKSEYERLNYRSPFSDLEAGSLIVLPSRKVTVIVPTELASNIVSSIRAVKSVTNVDLRNAEFIEFQGRVGGGFSEQEDAACERFTERDSAKKSLAELWKLGMALLYNEELDESVGGSWKRGNDHVNLAIFDSGMLGENHVLARRITTHLNADTSHSDRSADKDHEQASHGTGVMYLAAGGRFFPIFQPDAITLSPYKLYSERTCRFNSDGTVDSCGYPKSKDRLINGLLGITERRSDTQGVNISVAYRGEVPYLDRFIGHKQELLIVTSAGNDGDVLGGIAATNYPAMYGGGMNNVVTVSSVNHVNEILESANISPRYVDIAAWGCKVPVLEYDSEQDDLVERIRTGTSYAAPQVLFAAAMIFKERRARTGAFTPLEIKRRLISSADIHLPLWNSVKHGRVLNLEKAILLHSDVVELSDGRLLKGRVRFDDDESPIVRLCGGKEASRTDLLKLVDLGRNADMDGRYMIYSTDPVSSDPEARGIKVLWCDGIRARITIEEPLGGGAITTIEPGNYRDIIFASQPYWN